MPSCRITNYTSQPLNASLKHLCALHFENEIAPGQTVKLTPGRVWFTLEVLVDNKDNRYSVAQSAAAIAIVSLACVGAATVAVPAIAAAGGATAVGGTIAAGGAGVIAAGEHFIAGFASAFAATSGFLTAHAATAGKLAASFLPKAIDLVEKEVGGFNNVQKEVVAILSSPNVTEEVRTEGLSILSRLGFAVAADRAAAAEAEKEQEKAAKENSRITNPDHSLPSITDGTPSRPPLKRMQTSVSTLIHKVSTESRMERKAAKKEMKAAKEAASWEVVDFDTSSEPNILSSKERLRIHGLFMNERKHFEVREKDGKLVLIDANTREVVTK